jgi:hypothetical protein
MTVRSKSMKLNDNQKRFLFDNYYIDSKVLDSLTYRGWENYWINNFEFNLDTSLNRWNMRTLQIVYKDTKEVYIEVNLNFQVNDFKILLNIL